MRNLPGGLGLADPDAPAQDAFDLLLKRILQLRKSSEVFQSLLSSIGCENLDLDELAGCCRSMDCYF